VAAERHRESEHKMMPIEGVRLSELDDRPGWAMPLFQMGDKVELLLDDGTWLPGCTVAQCLPGTQANTINAFADRSTYTVQFQEANENDFTYGRLKQKRGVKINQIRAAVEEVIPPS